MERMRKRVFFFKKMAGEFRRTFGVGLPDYTDMFMGFDVVKFDRWLRVPDGVSTRDFIENVYGVEASALVERLVGA